MTQPLALVLYDRLLPGSQLVNHLQDLQYRVETVTDPRRLVECAEQTKPMLVLVDLQSARAEVREAIARLKQNPATGHLPVIGFGGDGAAAQAEGVTLVVSDTAILNHLPECLDQALQV